MKLPLSIALCLALCLGSGCVAKKKFKQEVGRREALEARQQELLLELYTGKGTIAALETFNANLTQAVADLQGEKLNLQNDIEKLQSRLSNVSSEKELQQEQYQQELRSKIAQLEVKEKLIARLNEAVQARDGRLEALRAELANALSAAGAAVSLQLKEGELHLLLPEALLFRDNTARLAPKAKEVLGLIAGILGRYTDLSIAVESHSDSSPPDRKLYKDNWQLTSLQATEIVRTLNEDFYLNPNQLSATGKGAFYPRASNDTKDGRTANRRTEIVLRPTVDEVYMLLK